MLPVTAELAPATKPRAHARVNRFDELRRLEFQRRLESGEAPLAAWSVIATDEKIGLSDWRGAPSIRVEAAVRTLGRFLRKIAPDSAETARALAEEAAARFTGTALATMKKIANGEFEDAEKARVQLAANERILKIVGIGADKQTRVTAISSTGPTQFNFGSVLRAPLPPA